MNSKSDLKNTTDLILVRGCSGAGKTTLANIISPVVFSADDYFYKITPTGPVYVFDDSKLGDAHKQCFQQTEEAIRYNKYPVIAVANTFTRAWEMREYINLKSIYEHLRVHTIVVENRHGGVNMHNVPEDVVTAQKLRFEVII